MIANRGDQHKRTRRRQYNQLHLAATSSLLLLAAFVVRDSFCVTRRANTWPLARSQRQTITSELATGLSGTGTSFNSIYSEPFYGQQQQQQQSIDELDYPGSKGAQVPILTTNRNLGGSTGYGYGYGKGWRGFGGAKGGGAGVGVKGGFKGSAGGRPPFYSSLRT